MQYVEKTGRTIDEAVTAALAEMNLSREDVTVEVLEKTKSGFLGLGGTMSKVRVTKLEPLDLFAKIPPPPPLRQEKPQPKPEPAKEAPKPRTVENESIDPKPIVPLAGGKADLSSGLHRNSGSVAGSSGSGATPAPQQRRRPPSPGEPHPKHVRAARDNNPAAPVKPREPRKPLPPATPESAELARFFIDGLLQHMKVDATAAVAMTPEGSLFIDIRGEDLGSLIGRRGDTLDAVQYLTSFVVARQQETPVRVIVDAENYRARREETLTKLAQRTAEKAVRYRRNLTLEPMNAYERHIIHTALQEYPGVSTHSVGSEPARRVVVQVARAD